jgi:hypothetical protein
MWFIIIRRTLDNMKMRFEFVYAPQPQTPSPQGEGAGDEANNNDALL